MLHLIRVFTVCQTTRLGQRVNSPLSDEFNQGMSLGPKVTRPVAHMLYIRLIKGNIKKSSCLKALGLRVNIIF